MRTCPRTQRHYGRTEARTVTGLIRADTCQQAGPVLGSPALVAGFKSHPTRAWTREGLALARARRTCRVTAPPPGGLGQGVLDLDDGAMTRTVTPSLAMAFSRSGAARSTCVQQPPLQQPPLQHPPLQQPPLQQPPLQQPPLQQPPLQQPPLQQPPLQQPPLQQPPLQQPPLRQPPLALAATELATCGQRMRIRRATGSRRRHR